MRFTDSVLRILEATEALTAAQRLVSEGEFYGRRFANGVVCPALRAHGFQSDGSDAMSETTTDAKALVLDFLETMGRGDFERLHDELLTDESTYTMAAPSLGMPPLEGRKAIVDVLRRRQPALRGRRRPEVTITRVVAEGDARRRRGHGHGAAASTATPTTTATTSRSTRATAASSRCASTWTACTSRP